jgi:glucosamine--fructose-6-phosphate aminotransferase (isomerizing)
MDEALPGIEHAVDAVATAFAYVGRMYVIGRGIEFATAREVALKLTETCRVAAEPLTSTDLAHGPIAALDPLFPVWTIASRDETLPIAVEAARRARATGATLVASGNAASEIEGAAYTLPVPEPPLPLLAPLLSVVPGQLFAAALALTRGLDSDHPEGLTKVTLAQ